MSEPAASVRSWGIRFVAGGDAFTIEPLPAADWIDAVLTGAVADLLTDTEADRLTDAVAAGVLGAGDLERVFADVVTEASGREWYVGLRLVSLLYQDDLRGEVMALIDPQARPLAAVLDVIYATCVRWKSAEKRQEFDALVFAPPDSAPGASNPRERAQHLREQSNRILAEREATGTTVAEPVEATVAERSEASDTPSSETPPTSG